MHQFNPERIKKVRQEFEKVLKALENCHPVDKTLMVPTSEFKRRQGVTWAALGKTEFGLPVFTENAPKAPRFMYGEVGRKRCIDII